MNLSYKDDLPLIGEGYWEEMEPDPDRLREDRDERLRLEKEYDEG